jgi:hypothetical protein
VEVEGMAELEAAGWWGCWKAVALEGWEADGRARLEGDAGQAGGAEVNMEARWFCDGEEVGDGLQDIVETGEGEGGQG